MCELLTSEIEFTDAIGTITFLCQFRAILCPYRIQKKSLLAREGTRMSLPFSQAAVEPSLLQYNPYIGCSIGKFKIIPV